MPIVIEIYKSGANIFRTASNFMTYDEPCAELLGYRYCSTDAEALGIYRSGAAVFSEYGPVGYRAFHCFGRFLAREGLLTLPSSPAPRSGRDKRLRRKAP